MRCERCGLRLDRRTSRHVDEFGEVMSHRDDLAICRPVPDREQFDAISARYPAAPSGIRYSGFDIVRDVDGQSG